MKLLDFFGNRVIKTGVAVLLTALLCNWIGWPPVFAVITAIVTIEPTVSDSIKKGLVRFPASAIGSGYAVLFISLFGDSAITYTLAAVFTISTCFRLKLHDGLLVAVLTSVAMIEVIHTNLFVSFLVRLGTTTIGLSVSTLVNMFILPPDYRKLINSNVDQLKTETAVQIEKLFHALLYNLDKPKKEVERKLGTIRNSILRTEKLSKFQKEETKYHPLLETELAEFEQSQYTLDNLRMIQYHLQNLIHNPIQEIAWTKEEKEIIMFAVDELALHLKDPSTYSLETHRGTQRKITEIFWEDNEEITKNSKSYPTNFSPELIILYELVSIYDLVAEIYEENNLKR